MEDPYSAMEGSIQEYSSEESSGKVRWILNKGLTVGKKILVTGFVISSAPVVVPPLVVISFLGFACSVPYGFLLASYACTDKLMSMLLPGSKPPPFLLDYVKVSCNDEVVEEDEYGEGEDVWLRGGIDMEKEEEEMLENTRETIEMRIELVENENDHYVYEVEHGGVRKDENEIEENGYDQEDVGEYEDENEIEEENGYEEDVGEYEDENEIEEENGYDEEVGEYEDENEIEEENGYEDDVGEYEDENEEEPMKLEFEVRIEGVGEEEEKEPAPDEVLAVVVDIEGDEKSGGTIEDITVPFEVTDIVVELCQSNGSNEDEEIVKETRGLLEKIREEGMIDNEEKNKQSVEKLSGEAEEGHQQVNRNVQEMEMPIEGRIGNKPLGNVENNNDKILKESYKVQETDDMRIVDVIPKEGDSKEMVGGLLKPIGEMIGMTDVGSTKEEEQKPVLKKPFMLQRGADDNNITKDVEKDIQLSREKENVISSNADVREIADESGFDLFDNKNGAAHSYADYNTVGENEHSSSICASPETVDYMALPVFSGERKRNGAGIRPQEGSSMASSKELYSEEKIWEQIDAMRRIIGYKAAPQGTCIEELKAMYLFTGVEPPALFKDPSDLVEVNEKLRFLMSVVGVK